jgi:hypothetical protein
MLSIPCQYCIGSNTRTAARTMTRVGSLSGSKSGINVCIVCKILAFCPSTTFPVLESYRNMMRYNYELPGRPRPTALRGQKDFSHAIPDDPAQPPCRVAVECVMSCVTLRTCDCPTLCTIGHALLRSTIRKAVFATLHCVGGTRMAGRHRLTDLSPGNFCRGRPSDRCLPSTRRRSSICISTGCSICWRRAGARACRTWQKDLEKSARTDLMRRGNAFMGTGVGRVRPSPIYATNESGGSGGNMQRSKCIATVRGDVRPPKCEAPKQ